MLATERTADAIDDVSFDALTHLLRTADDLLARAVTMIARLKHNGAVERETGLPVEMALRLWARTTRWDASELAHSSDVLAQMPRTAALLAEGVVSWSQARAIVHAVKWIDAAGRSAVDGMIAADAPGLMDAQPEELIDRVEDEVARLRPDLSLQREERAIERSFLALQPRLDGGGSLYGEADAERFATIAEALEAAAARPMHDEDDGRTRARQRMDALVAICESSLAGASAGARPKPRLIATMQLGDLEVGARVLAPVAGRPQRLTPLAADVLSCDAEIVPIIFDGARPVAVGDAYATVPAKLRTALDVRDGGCRFPGCAAPVSWCDAHHIIHREDGGPTCESNLVLLCRRCHRRMHRRGWRMAMEPDGVMTFRHRGRAFRSAPRAGPRRE